MNTPQKHRRKLLLGDGLLVGCILLVCIALAIVPHLSKKATSAFVKVSVDGKSYAVYPLEVDTTVEIGQTGVRFVIENGKAFIAASDCPDKLCMRAGALSEALWKAFAASMPSSRFPACGWGLPICLFWQLLCYTEEARHLP